MKKKILVSLIVLLLFSFLGNQLGLRFIHPQSGLRNMLGDATSSVALYRLNGGFQKGDLVVAYTGDATLDPTIARVSNTTETEVDIQSSAQIQRIARENVKGKLLVIFPFVGHIVKLLER